MAAKPKLFYKAEIKRSKYFRRFAWMLLAFVSSVGAWLALIASVSYEEVPDGILLPLGQIVASILIPVLFLRAVINLRRWFSTKNEKIRMFDRGFTWKRGKNEYKYSWSQLKTFRKGIHDASFLGRTIRQVGAHTFIMRDGQEFKITPRHGNTHIVAKRVDSMVGERVGTLMARSLRESRSVRIHPKLVVTPAGLVAGKSKIRWEEVDVKVQKEHLLIKRKDEEGQFKRVKSYPIYEIDNLAGFLDIADSMMLNYQPERFGIETYDME